MYKVKILKNGIGEFKKARLGISLGQNYHEGDKFISLCEWADTRFEHVEVMFADTLNRWNDLALNIAAQDWKKLGDDWLDRNEYAISLLSSKHITRWDDYRRHPDYIRSMRWVKQRYDASFPFKTMIDDRVSKVREKYGGDPFYIRSYLIEECSVSVVMAQQPVADVYPGSFLPIKETLGVNVNFTRVDFLRKEIRLAA